MSTELPPGAPPSHTRAGWPSRWFTGLRADLRFAWRTLLKNKGFAASALLTLTLCIGANTTIFSMLYALVIRPLPFDEPSRIVEVYNSFPKVGLDNMPSNVVQYLDFKEHAPAFARLALWQLGEATLGDEGAPSRVSLARTTADMFDVLRIQPLVGRFFTAEHHVPKADRVVVLTQSYWESNYQEDPGVLGRTVRLDGETFEIIGVAPHDLEAFDARVKLIRPLAWPPEAERPEARYGVSPRLYGRLAPGATIEQGLAQVTALERQVYESEPPQRRDFLDRSGHIMGVNTVQFQRVDPVRTSFLLLQGGALFVLLIGCVNVANLLLVRSNARRGELAIRAALGAGRAAIARQLIVESALLVALGALAGVALARASIAAANQFTAQLRPGALPFSIDGNVLAYASVVALLMALAIGALPVVHVLGGSLLGSIQTQSRSASGGRGVRVMSGALIVAQVAVALVLLVGAGLLIRSFQRVLSVDPGFDSAQLLTARVALSAGYRGDGPDGGMRAQQFAQRLLTSLEEIPGVRASLATNTPFQGGLPINAFSLQNYTLPAGAPQPGAFHLGASPSYLETLRIPLKEGRWFTDADVAKGRRVYVVDETFARRFFPDGSAVGQHVTFGAQPAKPEDWPEIVGVVGDVRHLGVEEDSGNPFLYHPLQQTPIGAVNVLIRTTRPAEEMLTMVRDKVAAIDPALPVFQTGTMEAVINESFSSRRGIMLLLLSFAIVAVVLSAIGIYGVLAYDVSQRSREIGIRGAVGATSAQIISLILKQGVWRAGMGLALGLAGAVAFSRFMASMLFDVEPTDPVAYVAVSALFLGVSLVASYLPARRAARIDPMSALRIE
jgi:putative ABC transport system permease protein